MPAAELNHDVARLQHMLTRVGNEHTLAREQDAVVHRLRFVDARRVQILPSTLPRAAFGCAGRMFGGDERILRRVVVRRLQSD